ncbi:coiled-coil domain-containing protein 164, partial [Clonorchis sinensis]
QKLLSCEIQRRSAKCTRWNGSGAKKIVSPASFFVGCNCTMLRSPRRPSTQPSFRRSTPQCMIFQPHQMSVSRRPGDTSQLVRVRQGCPRNHVRRPDDDTKPATPSLVTCPYFMVSVLFPPPSCYARTQGCTSPLNWCKDSKLLAVLSCYRKIYFKQEEIADVGPSVNSDDIEQRIAARTIRIKNRLLQQRPQPEEQDSESKNEELSLSKKQIETSSQRIAKLIRDGDTFVSNIRVACDARENMRRTEEDELNARRIEKLEYDATTGLDAFNKITEKWDTVRAGELPQEIREMLVEQKQQCTELVNEKNKLINELNLELKAKDDHYVRELRKRTEDVELLTERMETQIQSMQKTYREELIAIEESLNAQKDKLVADQNAEWEELMAEIKQKQINYLETHFHLVEVFDSELSKLRNRHSEEYNELKNSLESEVESLEAQLRQLKVTYQHNLEKLEYNFQVLKRRDEENMITKSNQKRKITRLQDTLNNLHVRGTRQEKQYSLENEQLSEDYKRRMENFKDLQMKSKTFMCNVGPLTGPIEQTTCRPPAVIAMQYAFQSQKTHAMVKAQANKIPQSLRDVSPEVVRDFLSLLCYEPEFLIEEKLKRLLKPLTHEEETLMRLDTILTALGVTNEEELDYLFTHFIVHPTHTHFTDKQTRSAKVIRLIQPHAEAVTDHPDSLETERESKYSQWKKLASVVPRAMVAIIISKQNPFIREWCSGSTIRCLRVPMQMQCLISLVKSISCIPSRLTYFNRHPPASMVDLCEYLDRVKILTMLSTTSSIFRTTATLIPTLNKSSMLPNDAIYIKIVPSPPFRNVMEKKRCMKLEVGKRILVKRGFPDWAQINLVLSRNNFTFKAVKKRSTAIIHVVLHNTFHQKHLGTVCETTHTDSVAQCNVDESVQKSDEENVVTVTSVDAAIATECPPINGMENGHRRQLNHNVSVQTGRTSDILADFSESKPMSIWTTSQEMLQKEPEEKHTNTSEVTDGTVFHAEYEEDEQRPWELVSPVNVVKVLHQFTTNMKRREKRCGGAASPKSRPTDLENDYRRKSHQSNMHEGNAGKETTVSKVVSTGVETDKRDDSHDAEYWDKYASTVVTAETEKVWDNLHVALERYSQILKHRAKLIHESEGLRRQNGELRHLLQQYLNAPVNYELQIPPAKTLHFD